MGLKDLQESLKNVLTFENILFLVVISLAVMHIISIMLVNFHIGVETVTDAAGLVTTKTCSNGVGCSSGFECSPSTGTGVCTSSRILTEFVPGPYLLYLLAFITVTFVFALIRRTYHEILITKQSLALILVTAVIIVAIFMYFDKLAPQLFKPAAFQARAALGLP